LQSAGAGRSGHGGGQDRFEFEDFKGGVGPVVFPADDEVAVGGVVLVAVEVFGLELELDAAADPAAAVDAALGFAVRKSGAAHLDQEAEFLCQRAEEADDAGLAGRRVQETGDIERVAEDNGHLLLPCEPGMAGGPTGRE
jgi:hypothetical protein